MSKQKRMGQILDLLAEKQEVSVQELVDTLGISPATARRDLDGLAEQQLLTRTRGGAMAHAIAFDLPVRYRDQRNASQKSVIAHAVSAMIPHGSIIGLSGGTTTTAVAEALMARPDVLESTGSPSLTVVTIGVNIATQLAMRPQIRTVIAGGVVNPRSYEAIGPYAEAVIKGVTLDYANVGTDGIDEVHGATSQDDHEAQVTKLMMSRAAKTILVADSTKFDRRAFATVGGPEEFATVVTDRGVSEDQLERFTRRGFDIKIADSP